MKKVKYGEIYYYDFGKHNGSIQNGLRPAVVIQDDRLNQHSPTTLIAAITSVTKKTYLPSHVILGEKFGLTKPSMALLEQVACVNQEDLLEYVGKIDDIGVRRSLRNGIKKTFGLWDYTLQGKADIRCLCQKCLQDYINTKSFIVKRLDPFSNSKEKCDKCNSYGYDYILIPRKQKNETANMQIHNSHI